MSNDGWSPQTMVEEFFVYGYLGVSKNDDEKVIITKCVSKAYTDMNRTLLTKKDVSFINNYRNQMVEIIANNFSDVVSMRSKLYKLFFDITLNDEEQEAVSLKGEVNRFLKKKTINDTNKRNDTCFYYGQAQKWINMTLKYLWLLGLVPDESKLDIPIDSYIMQAASEQFDIKFPTDDKKNNNKYAIYNERKTMPWSKFSKKEYDLFQKDIKQQCGEKPLTWEHNAWINVAIIRNNSK